MQYEIAVVRDGGVADVEGAVEPMRAASLVKPVLAHLALQHFDDLDVPIHDNITVRHVLSHTTGLPNWRSGERLVPLRPPGVQWGYSGEGYVLLQKAIEQIASAPIDAVAREQLFAPLAMHDTRFDEPEPGFHGSRPLLTTAADYGRFLVLVLTIDDERWQPLCRIDDELAWAAGWGLELGDPVYGWQWGLDIIPNEAGNFVIGCRETADGVVVLTDDATNGRGFYRDIVARVLPGDHASLRVEHNATWLALNA